MLSINACNVELVLAGLSLKNETSIAVDPFLAAHLPVSKSHTSKKLCNLSRKISIKKIKPISVPFLLLSEIIPLLIRRNNFLLHSACLFKGDRLIILIGPSGSGKSSVSAELILRGFTSIGDDKVIFDKNLNALYGNPILSLREKKIASRLSEKMDIEIERSSFTSKFYLRNKIFQGPIKIKKTHIFKVRSNQTHLNSAKLSTEVVTYEIFKDVLASFYGFESFSMETSEILFPSNLLKDHLIKILKSIKKRIIFNKNNLFYLEGRTADIAAFIESIII